MGVVDPNAGCNRALRSMDNMNISLKVPVAMYNNRIPFAGPAVMHRCQQSVIVPTAVTFQVSQSSARSGYSAHQTDKFCDYCNRA